MATKTITPAKQQTDLSAVERLLVPQQQLAEQRLKSFLFVKKLVAVSVSNIAYFRMLYPKKCFNDSNLDGQVLHLLKKGPNVESTKLVSLLQSVYEAIDKKYIYLDDENPDVVCEAYSFTFVYSGEDVICDFYNKNKSYCTSSSYAVTAEASKNLLAKIQEILSCLPPLPEKCFFRLKLGYYERTPADYEPPGFKPAKAVGFRFSERSGTLPLGNVETPVSAMNLSVRTVESSWKKVEKSTELVDLQMDNDILKDFDSSAAHHEEQAPPDKVIEASERSQPSSHQVLQSIENDEQVQVVRRHLSQEVSSQKNSQEKQIEAPATVSVFYKENLGNQTTSRVSTSPSNLETIQETSPMSEISMGSVTESEKKDDKSSSAVVTDGSQRVNRKAGSKSRVPQSGTQEEEEVPAKRKRAKRGAYRIIDSDEESENETMNNPKKREGVETVAKKSEQQKVTESSLSGKRTRIQRGSPKIDTDDSGYGVTRSKNLTKDSVPNDKSDNDDVVLTQGVRRSPRSSSEKAGSERSGETEIDIDDVKMRCPCGIQEMETVMVECCKCGMYGHLSCYGYATEDSVPDGVVCYYCCVASIERGEADPPGCSIDAALSEKDAQFFCQMRQAILFASERPTITAASIMERLFVNRNRAQALLNRLIKENVVEKKPVKPKSKEHEVKLSVLLREGVTKYYVGLSFEEMAMGTEQDYDSEAEFHDLDQSVDIVDKTRSLSLDASGPQNVLPTSSENTKENRKSTETASMKTRKQSQKAETQEVRNERASDSRTPLVITTGRKHTSKK